MGFLDKNKKHLTYNDNDIETYFSLIIKILSAGTIFLGVNGKDNFQKYGVLAKVPIFSIMTIVGSIYVATVQMIYIFELASSDVLLAATIFCNVFTNINCVSKGIRLSTKIKDFQEVLNDISTMWNMFLPKGKYSKQFIERAQSTLFFVKVFSIILVGLIFSCGLPPILSWISQFMTEYSANHTYDFSNRLFDVKYNFSINDWVIYLIILFEEYWLLFGLAIFWVGCDCMYASFTSHLSIHFEILHHDISTLVNNENNEDLLRQKFMFLIERHRNILRVCRKVNRIFGPVIFVNVLVASADICVNIYVSQKLIVTGEYTNIWIYLSFAFGIFVQIIVYCTFAETLAQKSLLISDALYNSDWTNKSQQFKRDLRIVLLRTQAPFYISGYGYFTISHKKLMQIMNSAMSYFMMLNTTTQ